MIHKIKIKGKAFQHVHMYYSMDMDDPRDYPRPHEVCARNKCACEV